VPLPSNDGEGETGEDEDDDDDMWTSAKSMFWVADRYGLSELVEAAREHLRSELTPANVADEVCSSFSRDFPDVRKEQFEFLREHWVRASSLSLILAALSFFST
jgi:hypothetical protein